MFKIIYYRTLFSQSAASLTAGYLAAYARQNGYHTLLELLEYGRMDNMNKILSEQKDFQVIIYKCNFQDYLEGCELLRNIKKIDKDKKIFLMGYFAEINAANLLQKYEYIDGIIYGDGCHFIKTYAQSDGILLKGGMFRNRDCQIYEDKEIKYMKLSELPNPARDIEKKELGKYINLVWRNGCFGDCKYCHINIVKRPFTARKIEDVVDEMEYCYRQLGKTMFIFNDSVFWWGERDDDDLDRFVQLIEEKELDINFMVYLRCVPFIGEERLKKLKKAGLRRVFIGIENVSNQFSKEYGKSTVNYDTILETFRKLNVSYHIGFMLFHPSVTMQELRENIEYLHKLNKLYRIGIILEKMRIIPLSTVNIKPLEHKGIDQAYDYQFDSPEVGKVYDILKKFFEEILDARNFENVCTSCLYLINLYTNKYGDAEAEIFKMFEKTIMEYNDFAKDFLLDVICNVEKHKEEDLYEKLIREHKEAFQGYYYLLQTERGAIYDYIGQHDKELCLAVFHGQRRLNAYD